MKNTKKIIGALLCSAMLFTLGGCSEKEEPALMDQTLSVTAAEVSRSTLSTESTYIGTISAEGTASVVSLVAGTVEYVAVSMGDQVEAGDLLCNFDDEGARLALSSAEASLRSAEASLRSAEDGYTSSASGYGGEDMSVIEEQVRMAKENYEATKVLFEAGAASRLEVDQALSAYNSAKASLEAAKGGLNATKSGVDAARAGVEAARTGVASASYQLSLYQLTSPISGTVESVNVISDNFTPTGTVAFIISNADNKTATFYVTDEVMKSITVGQAVTVSARDKKYEGAISEVSGIVDAATGMFRIKALIKDARELPDGLSVSVTTVSNTARDAVVVPSDALYFDNGVAYVYTIEDNTAKRRDVAVSLYTKEKTAIASGIDEGDMLITSWSSTLKDGSPVTPVTEAENTSKEAPSDEKADEEVAE